MSALDELATVAAECAARAESLQEQAYEAAHAYNGPLAALCLRHASVFRGIETRMRAQQAALSAEMRAKPLSAVESDVESALRKYIATQGAITASLSAMVSEVRRAFETRKDSHEHDE